MAHRRWSVACLLLILSGCVEVNTYVGSRGKINQNLVINVPQRSADGMKQIVQSYLGREWTVQVEGRGEQRSVRAQRTFSAVPEGKPMPGVSMQFQRQEHWYGLRAIYKVQVRYIPKELLQTPDEEKLVANRKVTVRFFMPGRILPESSVQPKDGNFVELSLDPTQPIEVNLTSVGIVWWKVGLLLLILIALLWFLAPYLPRILERLPRRTVRVVQR